MNCGSGIIKCKIVIVRSVATGFSTMLRSANFVNENNVHFTFHSGPLANLGNHYSSDKINCDVFHG